MLVKIVNQSAYPTPKYATPLSAGLDLNANIEAPIELKPLERVIVPTGLFIELPSGFEAQIRPRSGLAAKYGITVANAPGTIDADYRGEIKIILINLSKEPFVIKPGERIAQMVVARYQQIEWREVESLSETLRGESGFGSTGLGINASLVSVSKICNKQRKPDIVKLYTLYRSTSGVCTDSRKVQPKSMFFALKGSNFNGNAFVEQALCDGAAYAVADNAALIRDARKRFPKRIILVDDVLKTLQLMARHHRFQFRAPVIALTGTNGKTTTKELITNVLRTKYNVVATEGNFNNDIGVPLTLLKMDKETEVAVIEMGASHIDDIKQLASIVCPTFGLITSIGKAHLQGFGSLDGVKKAKGALYDNLLEYKKIAFVNTDDPILKEMVEERPELQIVPYGITNNCAKIISNKSGDPYLKMEIPDFADSSDTAPIKIKTKLIGSYNCNNILAALSVATYFAIPASAAVKAIEDYIPSNNRSQMNRTANNTLIKDTYNANPTSMEAALNNFKELNFKNKVLLLGDMKELGQDSKAEHSAIIEKALSLEPVKAVFIGPEFKKVFQEHKFQPSGDTEIMLFRDTEEAAGYLKENPLKKCTILIKGSHSMNLESLFTLL